MLGELEGKWAVRPLLRDALVLARRPDGHWRLFSVAEGYDGSSEAMARRGVARMPLTSEKGNASCLMHDNFKGTVSRTPRFESRPSRKCVFMREVDLFEVGGSLWMCKLVKRDCDVQIQYLVQSRMALALADGAEAAVKGDRWTARAAAFEASVAQADPYLGKVDPCGSEVIQFTTSGWGGWGTSAAPIPSAEEEKVKKPVAEYLVGGVLRAAEGFDSFQAAAEHDVDINIVARAHGDEVSHRIVVLMVCILKYRIVLSCIATYRCVF